MDRSGEFRMLMAVEYGRSEVLEGSTPCRIAYMFRKATPFGMLEATDTVDVFTFNRDGAQKTDARMLKELSERLNREELAMLTEGCANSDFGEMKSVASRK